jgi:hypothetical protein
MTDGYERVRVAYTAFGAGFDNIICPLPPWEELPDWMRAAFFVAYLQGTLDKIGSSNAKTGTVNFECAGRKKEGGECFWPDCLCDPHAVKVIESLIDRGWVSPKQRNDHQLER